MARGDAVREILNGRMDELNPTTKTILESVPDETVRKAYAKLLELGLTDEKIATRAYLLSMNPETLQRNADSLKQFGLSNEKIASQAHLLGRDPETIQRNYEFLRRFFSKDEIMENAQLLGSSQKTIESSVQFLAQLGIDYKEMPFACGTKASTKRKKIAVLLREKYGFNANLSKEERKELAEKARDFVRSRPQVLRMSEKKIKEKYC